MSFHSTLLFFLDLTSNFYNSIVTFLTWMFFQKNLNYPIHKTGGVLIVGCTSGMGTHLAETLAMKGITVFAGLRNMKDVNKITSNMDPTCAQNVIPIHLDVCNQNLIDSALKSIELRLMGQPLIGIVHCAGTHVVSPLECASKQDYSDVYQVNTIGPLLVTKAFLPLLRESCGRVVFISSIR